VREIGAGTQEAEGTELELFFKKARDFIVISKRDGKLFLHQTRVIAKNTCLNLN
jgi:hypothetical protein